MTYSPLAPLDHDHLYHAGNETLPGDTTGDLLVQSRVASWVGDATDVETLDYVYAKSGAMFDLAAGFGAPGDIVMDVGPALDG